MIAGGKVGADARALPHRTGHRGLRLAIGAVACAFFALLPLRAAMAQANARQAVAIVVNPKSTVTNLSFAELRRIFLGEQQFWSDRSKITLLVRAPVAHEREVVLDQIYKMDEDQFRQYWIGKMFRAEVAGGPKIVYSSDMAINLVGVIPGSITFVLASAVTPGTRVLRIDGKLPSDSGYPLK
jgi:ABC-type phosphate transport system substrate-binding protein